jgi:hypothetical protein
MSLCECGCGKEAKEGNRFIKFHGFKKNGVHAVWKGGKIKSSASGLLVYAPNHPRAQRHGNRPFYVLEHILIAERALGKPLDRKHPIHHPTHNRFDNTSLVICEDDNYHQLLHKRERALKACGHVDWLKCVFCKQYDVPEKITIRPKSQYHQSCQNKYYQERKANQNGIRAF